MCGICGVFGIEDKTLIGRMLDVLKHRGPDGNGIFTDTGISLGHARLKIIDLSENGKQPMSNENGDIWLVVNGEIYNFIELRETLSAKGHIFKSRSDSEVIIHAYEEYGFEFVQKIQGMYALALYDAKKKRLILARDPIGEKPLYYFTYDNECIYFASEIKGLLQTGLSREIDYDAVWGYLAYQYSLGENTLFKGIKKVLPGTMMICENGSVQYRQYWDIIENIRHLCEDAIIKRFRSLLEQSVKSRMVADVPIGAFLSGGIDSSAIVALARPYTESTFHTFSVGFETFSELKYASMVSEHLDTEHHEILISGKTVFQELKKIAWLYDEPLGDAAIINNYFLSKVAKKYVSVVLAGEGGDEVFAGYSNYVHNLNFINRVDQPGLLNFLLIRYSKYLPVRYGLYDSNRYISIIRQLKYFNEPSVERSHLNTTRIMADEEIKELTTLSPIKINDRAVYPVQINNSLNKMQAVDCKNLLPEKFLMKSDKGTMANAVEARIPLLDRRIIELSFSIPPELKIKNKQDKYIFRKSISDLLPKEIVNRPKQGFGTPVGYWLENELHEILSQTMTDGKLLNGLFRPGIVSSVQKNLDIAIRKNPFKIWTFFALELWFDTYAPYLK